MESVLKGVNKVIIDGQQGGVAGGGTGGMAGVVPYLPLPALEARPRAPQQQPGAAASGVQGGGQ
jgi:hypothetical protein